MPWHWWVPMTFHKVKEVWKWCTLYNCIYIWHSCKTSLNLYCCVLWEVAVGIHTEDKHKETFYNDRLYVSMYVRVHTSCVYVCAGTHFLCLCMRVYTLPDPELIHSGNDSRNPDLPPQHQGCRQLLWLASLVGSGESKVRSSCLLSN